MSEDVIMGLEVDTSQAEASIAATKAKSDAAVKEWRIRRIEITQGIREALTLVSTAYSTFTQFMQVIGGSIDPFYSALIGMVISSVSMMLSMSTALAATGVGIPAAAVIAGIGLTMNSMLIAKLLLDKANSIEAFNAAKWAQGASQQSGMGTHGG